MFDLNTSILDSKYGEELDECRLEEYINKLTAEFAESPEATTFMREFGTSSGWPDMFMHFAGQYFCATPATITPGETAEILFEIFPRKVSVESDAAYEIVSELRAFWQFLKRTRSLAKADAILQFLTDDDADRLAAALSDPRNFGMAKSLFSAGSEAGFDMTDEEDLNQFIMAYNASLGNGPATIPEMAADDDDLIQSETKPDQTLFNPSRRIGRNEPCPCGSGAKYKKCCGR